jgi:DNA modification methylase
VPRTSLTPTDGHPAPEIVWKGSDALRPLLAPITVLVPLPGNPRRGDVEAVMGSYQRFGQLKPIVVRKTRGRRFEVIAGNHQLAAAALLSWTHMAVVVMEGSVLESRAFALADNRTSDLGEYDLDELLAMLQEVATDADLLAATGYDQQYVDELLAVISPPLITAPDDIPDPPVIRVTEPGDLWLLGPHRLVCGDGTDPATLATVLDGSHADMVWTDPPYGVDYSGGQASDRDRIEGDADDALYQRMASALGAATKPTAALYLWFASTHGLTAYQCLAEANWTVRSLIIWNKVNPHFGAFMAQYMPRMEPCLYAHRSGKSPTWVGPTNEVNVWDVEQPARNELHPTQKPVELAARAIRNSSRAGHLVLDPFAGSGTVLVAAHETSRLARMVEIDPVFCDVICARWQGLTGDKPIRGDEPHDFTEAA